PKVRLEFLQGRETQVLDEDRGKEASSIEALGSSPAGRSFNACDDGPKQRPCHRQLSGYRFGIQLQLRFLLLEQPRQPIKARRNGLAGQLRLLGNSAD